MATQVLMLSTAQVAGNLTTQLAGLTCLQIDPSTAIADIATVNQALIDDQQIVSRDLAVPSATTVQSGVIFTASCTKGATTLTSFVLVSPSTASISAITANMYIAGPGVAPGSRVLSASGTTITLDRATWSATTTQYFVATPNNTSGMGCINGGFLYTPRGRLQIFPKDVVAFDNLGYPYLIPANSVNFNGGGLNSGAPFLLV